MKHTLHFFSEGDLALHAVWSKGNETDSTSQCGYSGSACICAARGRTNAEV